MRLPNKNFFIKIRKDKAMSEKSMSEFLGEQLRKYRKMVGMTMEDLAEKMHVSTQTISNYEKKGITNVDTEREISRILGKDLRIRTADNEGTVGEVGREILYTIIEQKGRCSFDFLSEHKMYGMSEERIGHEIEKLSDLDMCYREKYTDFFDENRDELFITAKGIITYKNLIKDKFHEDKLEELLPNVETYEMRLSKKYSNEQNIPDASDMEEYIKLRPWIPHIFQLGLDYNFRLDYIMYLYLRWTHLFQDNEIFLRDKYYQYEHIFCGINIYHDILYRMTFEITNEWIDKYMFLSEYTGEEVEDLESRCVEEGYTYALAESFDDKVIQETIWNFKQEFPWIDEEYEKRMNKNVKHAVDEELEDYMDNRIEFYGFSEDLEGRYKENAPEGKREEYPINWFTKEEIEAFIRENFHKPSTKIEYEIQEKLTQIERMIPCAEKYYVFPEDWENNGLADLVRELCCVEK